ncbi:hypothetical protein, partial [Serratia fonticola]
MASGTDCRNKYTLKIDFRLKLHRKPHFIAISGMSTRHHYAPEDYVHAQNIFKTMIHFPNH